MTLQKSDLQLENIVFRKSQELNVFYPFLFQSLLYMALKKKRNTPQPMPTRCFMRPTRLFTTVGG